MRYLRWKRALLAFLCAGFLLDLGCPNQTNLQTAASNMGQTFANNLFTSIINRMVNDSLGTKLPT